MAVNSSKADTLISLEEFLFLSASSRSLEIESH